MIIRIGLDDTDNLNYGCTTYIAAEIIEEIFKHGYNLKDFPYLVRLNPNIPYKTRGNASISLIVDGDENLINLIINKLKNFKFIIDPLRNKPQPVLAFYVSNKIPNGLRNFYKKALTQVINIDEAIEIANKYKINYYPLLNGTRGLIGSLAAIGADLSKEYSYELLAYRDLNDTLTHRNISYKLVEKMDEIFSESTFGNIDKNKKRVLITPHGSDPVFLGIRGYDPNKLIQAYNFLNVEDKITKWIIYKTNQGTDIHLKIAKELDIYKPYYVFNKTVILIEDPKIICGGHVILKVRIKDIVMDAIAYKQSGILNRFARLLKKGDIIEIGGGINKNSSINIEKIIVKKLTTREQKIIPYCIYCGKKMDSEGDGQGIRCDNCAQKYPFKFSFIVKENCAYLKDGMIILPDYSSRRHLSKYENYTTSKVIKFSSQYFHFKLKQTNIT
jgi:Predicted DNA-binding protein containing a Zn-ribbon domain